MARAFSSESDFVRWLRSRVPKSGAGVRLGIGDDAALIRTASEQELILTTDMSVEGVHFLRRLHPPRSIGHRALARSLSDVAAMGGTPRFALVSLGVSLDAGRRWIEQLYSGLNALARAFGVRIVGGDTSMTPGSITLDVVVVGEIPQGAALLRSGARPGDFLYVSGRLGVSSLGLRLLRSGGGGPARGRTRRASRSQADALRHHLFPVPRCVLGRFLSRKKLASAMIDLSDGLSTDLHHLAESSGVGAEVWVKNVPTAAWPKSSRAATRYLLEHALDGGEDYELLFTVPAHKAPQIPRFFRGTPLSCIGKIRRSRELILVLADGSTRPLEAAGYDHFRKER